MISDKPHTDKHFLLNINYKKQHMNKEQRGGVRQNS